MKLKLIDTGYISAVTALVSQVQLSPANRAGFNGTDGVTILSLDNITVQTIGGGSNDNDTPQVSTTRTEVSKNSSNNEVIVLKCTIDTKTLPVGTFDKNYIYQLNRMKQTDGVKLLYTEGTGNYNTSLMYLAEEFTNGIFSTDFIPTDIPYLPIQIIDIKFTDRKDVHNKCGVDITCKITK